MPHILIVCTANICRSPVAKAVLQDRLQKRGLIGWLVDSAGTWAVEEREASRYSTEVMHEKGFDLSNHRAQMITNEMLKTADLILCMETGHVEALQAEFPRYADKIYLLSQMIGKRFSISDPYGGPLDGYQSMAKEITNIIDEGLERIIALAQADN
jgi:protein-tyrosine-phosphatase